MEGATRQPSSTDLTTNIEFPTDLDSGENNIVICYTSRKNIS